MNYDVRVWLFVVAFAGAVLFAFASVRGHRITLLGALAGLWLLDVALISQGWRDVDGWLDCHDACSSGQIAAGVIAVWAPILFVVLFVALLVLTLRRRMGA
ncbi:MAG TPA: hypothetical protein VGQ84_12460 [Gaiellaceae bacterium]|nr:hypothetical protein [Gaiellaceae bacterium]